MNNFNLMVSTSRFNEDHAKAEIWFTLLTCGDRYSIISNLDFSGLIAVLTTLNHRNVISKIKRILTKDPNFFQYILKIIPIDYVCQTNIKTIKSIIQNHYRDYIHSDESFMIELNRRKNDLIERDSFIESIAKFIENKVNLENPDKIIRIEILRNVTGISFLQQNDVIKAKLSIQN
ncbi:MAG: THUMP domain-containing protein [Candidatus Hermodarchaeota archaeon]